MFKHTFFLLFLTLFVNHEMIGQAQQDPAAISTIFDKSQQHFFNKEDFKIDLAYALYRNKKSPIIITSYEGMLIKKGDNLYLKIHNTEFISSEDKIVKINHEQKAIEILPRSQEEAVNNPLFIANYLKQFSDKKITQKDGQIVCELVTPSLTQLPYGAVTLYFDKDTYYLEKQTLTLVTPARFKDENNKYTSSLKYLDIGLGALETITPLDNNLLNLNSYVTFQNGKIIPIEKYSEYKIIERTVNQ